MSTLDRAGELGAIAREEAKLLSDYKRQCRTHAKTMKLLDHSMVAIARDVAHDTREFIRGTKKLKTRRAALRQSKIRNPKSAIR